VECGRLVLGPGSRVLEGAVVECDEFELGEGGVVGPGVRVRGGRVKLGRGFRVGAGTLIEAREWLVVGPLGSLGEHNHVTVRRARMGREFYTGPEVRIGGGSWNEVQSELSCGYWVHLGLRTFVNTARKVTLGNEVGIGTDSKVFTHGAYQSVLRGYPVSFAPVEIGDNCWVPGAVVNPGVTIGRDAVVGVGSVVNRSLPPGCLAAGVPCRVLRENAFPRALSEEEWLDFWRGFCADAGAVMGDTFRCEATVDRDGLGFRCHLSTVRYELSAVSRQAVAVSRDVGDSTRFDLGTREVVGPADAFSEKLRDLLRRYGIRFRSEAVGGEYRRWEEE
jgi:acetyltransferase-like isoleucine patch superfamily enzyme